MPKKKLLDVIDLKNIMISKTVDEVLVNKGNASYQCSPNFPYVVKTLNLLSKHFNWADITFAQLEEALDMEESGSKRIILQRAKSEFLEELYTKLLRSCRKFVKNGETNAYLYKFVEEHLFYFKDGKNPFGHIRYESDVPSLSSEEKLLILRALLDEKMGIDAADAFDANYTPDELRLEPLTVDRRNRKFWYFGDTYLFMEQKVSKKNPGSAPEKSRTRSTSYMNNDSDENDEASQKNLPEFCIVCKTSDDWAQLIAAYELQRNTVDKEVAGILKEQINLIRVIERKRIKAMAEVIPGSRASTRLKQKEIENKEKLERQKEEERLLDEILQTRKRRQDEKEASIKERKEEEKKETREERFRRRQELWAQLHPGEEYEPEPTSSRNSQTPRETSIESQPPAKRPRLNASMPEILDDIAVDVEKIYSDELPSNGPSSNETITSMDSNQTIPKFEPISDVAVDLPKVNSNAVLASSNQTSLRHPTNSHMPNHVLYSNPSQANATQMSSMLKSMATQPIGVKPGYPNLVPVVRQKGHVQGLPVNHGQYMTNSNSFYGNSQQSSNQYSIRPSASQQPQNRSNNQNISYVRANPSFFPQSSNAEQKISYYTTQGQLRVIRSPNQRPIRVIVRQPPTQPIPNVTSAIEVHYSPTKQQFAPIQTYPNRTSNQGSPYNMKPGSSQQSLNGGYYGQ